MPQQIVDIQPMLGNCEIAFFTGYDPPRTLAPAIAMAPVVTMNTPQISPPAPMPSPTQDPGPRKTLLSTNVALGSAIPPTPTRTQNSSLVDWAPGRRKSPKRSGSQTAPSGAIDPEPDPRSDGEDTRQNTDPRTQLQTGESIKSERGGAQKADALVSTVKDAGQGAISDQPDEPAQSTITVMNNDNPVSVLGSDSHLQANSVAILYQIASDCGITINRISLKTGDPGTFIEASDESTVISSKYDSFTVGSRASRDPTMAGSNSSGPHVTGLAGSGNSPTIGSALGLWNNSRSGNGTGAGTGMKVFTGTANILPRYLFAKLMLVAFCTILASAS